MDLRQLTPDLFVAPQLRPADLPRLAKAGIRAVVNNRPDGEEAGQPTSEELEAAARDSGIAYRHLPIVPGQYGAADIGAFDAALRELPRPLLAFCRTGTRSASLWALGKASGSDAAAIVTAAAQAGYDLSALQPRIAGRQAERPA